MKRLPLVALLLAAMTATSFGEDASPFQSFEGNFSKHARVEITSGEGLDAFGRITPRFAIGRTGQSARLKIRGTVTLNGVTRPLTLVYLFRPLNIEGLRRAALSNLAPGIDDGYAAEAGNYSLTSRTLRAEFPFVFGTTKGTAIVSARLKKRPRTTELTVTHKLTSNTLTSPITWTFRGLRRR